MVKIYFNKVRRLLAVLVVCLVAANASATPYKNIYIQLNSNAEGRGIVYVKTKLPNSDDFTMSRKQEKVDAKVTIGENGTDLSRKDNEAWPEKLRGFYMAGLFGVPEDGFHLAGFSLELKADDAYTTADFLIPASTDSNGFTDPFVEDGGLCFNANCDRDEDARSDDKAFEGDDSDDNEQAYAAAQALNNWNTVPDHVIYAVFLPGDAPGDADGIKDVQNNLKTTQAYTLTGQMASDAQRGIVIVNGKKVVRK